MKKTFCQIAQDCANHRRLTDFECRTVLQWFQCPSLYFPTSQDRTKALEAFVWLYQAAAEHDNIHLHPEAAAECAARFSKVFSLSAETAEHLLNDFLHRLHTKKPVIIGIEGLDGSGKAVQSKELCTALKEHGKQVCTIDFPQYSSFLGREIGRFLSGKDNVSAMELDEKSMCLWYAADRWKTMSGVDLEKFDYLIFNRYTLSNVVYQSARRYGGLNREFADWIFELEHIQFMLPVPDLYLYFDARTEFCQENVLKKDRTYVDGLDVYEKSNGLLSCCHNIYKELAGEIDEMVVLECLDESGALKSIETISAQVIQCLNERGLYG